MVQLSWLWTTPTSLNIEFDLRSNPILTCWGIPDQDSKNISVKNQYPMYTADTSNITFKSNIQDFGPKAPIPTALIQPTHTQKKYTSTFSCANLKKKW